MGFLNGTGGQQGKAGLADCHYILVIAEDGQGLGGDRARGDIEDRAGQFAGNLVHVRDHQQQALRRGEGGGERSGLECAVYCTGSAAFRLHLDHKRHGPP